MRKLFTLLFCIALAAAAFFFGWAQLSVPPGFYAVMRSKTHGVDPQVIREGEFRWVWYKLIPTNVVIQAFSLETVDKPFQAAGNLPQGDVYAAFTGSGDGFPYEIAGSLSFSLKPEGLPALVEAENITTQEDLRAYQERLGDKIADFALQRLRSLAENGELPGDMAGSAQAGRLENDILAAFPGVDRLSCSVSAARFPDFALYAMLRSLYSDYLDRQREILRPAAGEAADKRLESQARFDELARYGELLTKYPALLQYLALEKSLPAAAQPGR